MTHTLRFAARTDRGLLRANNQDSVFAGNRLLVVADGMGGHVAGDTASRLAVAAFAPLDDYDPKGRDLLTPLEHATEDGNEAIADMVSEDPDLDGMGTTVTALLFDGTRLGIAHVGDSRAYLWRGGVLAQITHDDTFVQSLIDEGRITEAEAARHPQRSLLLRALNGSDVDPTLALREARVSDRYLVCSDGLSGVISAEAIADTLASYDTAEAADRLIELALRGGGPDNVTVIVADVLDTGEAAALDDEPLSNLDADATGPIDAMRFTRRMPRVPLPKEPDVTELAARAAAQKPVTAPMPLPPADLDDLDDQDDDDQDDDDQDDDELADDEDDSAAAAPPRSRARRWGRRLGVLVAIFALLVIGGVLGVNWVGTQYYVSDNDGQVVVFRGVDGSVFGISLSSAQEDSCWGADADCLPLNTTDLMPAAQDQVLSGIPASDLQNAREILRRLSVQMLPLCAAFGTTTSPTPGTTTTTASSAPAGSTGAGSTGAGSTGAGGTAGGVTGAGTAGTGTELGGPAGTGPGITQGGTAGNDASGTLDPGATDPTTAGTTSPSISTPPATTLSVEAPAPGVNCRVGP